MYLLFMIKLAILVSIESMFGINVFSGDAASYHSSLLSRPAF